MEYGALLQEAGAKCALGYDGGRRGGRASGESKTRGSKPTLGVFKLGVGFHQHPHHEVSRDSWGKEVVVMVDPRDTILFLPPP